jgi:hypothetical protein
MRVWRKGGNYSAKEYSVIVAPGVLFPDATEFFDESGKAVQFNVIFKYGQTDELPSNLAQFLLDQGLAQETRFIL